MDSKSGDELEFDNELDEDETETVCDLCGEPVEDCECDEEEEDDDAAISFLDRDDSKPTGP